VNILQDGITLVELLGDFNSINFNLHEDDQLNSLITNNAELSIEGLLR